MARDIRTRLIADDDMTPAFKTAGRSATKLALEVEASQLRVEKSAKAAAAAEQRFGKESLQAREAAHRLAVAELELAAVTDKTKEATEKATDATERNTKSVDRSGGALRRFGGGLRAALIPLGRVAATTAAVGGAGAALVAGVMPAVSALTRLVVAGGHVAAALAPAAAALPALAAGALLVRGTVTLAGPAMLRAIHPVTDAWRAQEGPVGRLASRHLPALSREFVKVNFPAIRGAMRAIARETNSVVVEVGKWVNSTAGQSAIGAILKGTLGVTRELAGVLPGVVTSFGNMVGRAAGPGFAELGKSGGVLDRLAGGAKRLFDSVSGADVSRAFGAIEGYGKKFASFGTVIVDVGNWMNDNRPKVVAFSDALAGLGIALGILTGNPIPILIGSLTLLANHWDTVKDSVSGAVGWFREADKENRITAQSTTVVSQAVSGLVGWYKDWLIPALTWTGKTVMPQLRGAMGDLGDAFKEISQDSKFWTGFLKVLGAVLIGVLVGAIMVVVGTIRALTLAFRSIVWFLHNVTIPAFMAIGSAAQDATGAALRFFRALPRQIGAVFDKAKNWLNDAGHQIINGLLNGGRAAISGVGRWAGELKDSVVGAVKKVFGIKSPSRVMAGLGGSMVDGLIHGIVARNPTSLVLKVFGGMNQALTSMVGSGLVDVMNLPAKALKALGGSFGTGFSLFAGLSPAESFIVSHESGGRTNAQNPTSTAFGLGQLLLGNRQHYGALLGVSPDTTNYTAQLQMMRMYIRDRYGTAEAAAGFWKAHHWYDQGGIARGPGMIAKLTSRPERVLSPAQTVSFDRLVRVLDRRGGAGGGVVHNHYSFPNYVGPLDSLKQALVDLDRQGRLPRTSG